jgi:hypothetical protein
MVITLSAADKPATSASVDLTGGWQWGGLEGNLEGGWAPGQDSAAVGCFPLLYICSVGLNLLPPPNSCPEIPEPFDNTIDLYGWFDGSATLVGIQLKGTYWEGAGNGPCSGPVLISLDTGASFARN